jgi:hypothetical protein
MLSYEQIAQAFSSGGNDPVTQLLAENQSSLDKLAQDDYDLATLLAKAALAYACTKRMRYKAALRHHEALNTILENLKTYLEEKD